MFLFKRKNKKLGSLIKPKDIITTNNRDAQKEIPVSPAIVEQQIVSQNIFDILFKPVQNNAIIPIATEPVKNVEEPINIVVEPIIDSVEQSILKSASFIEKMISIVKPEDVPPEEKEMYKSDPSNFVEMTLSLLNIDSPPKEKEVLQFSPPENRKEIEIKSVKSNIIPLPQKPRGPQKKYPQSNVILASQIRNVGRNPELLDEMLDKSLELNRSDNLNVSSVPSDPLMSELSKKIANRSRALSTDSSTDCSTDIEEVKIKNKESPNTMERVYSEINHMVDDISCQYNRNSIYPSNNGASKSMGNITFRQPEHKKVDVNIQIVPLEERIIYTANSFKGEMDAEFCYKIWRHYSGGMMDSKCFTCQESISIEKWKPLPILGSSNMGMTRIENYKPVCLSCFNSIKDKDLYTHIFSQDSSTSTGRMNISRLPYSINNVLLAFKDAIFNNKKILADLLLTEKIDKVQYDNMNNFLDSNDLNIIVNTIINIEQYCQLLSRYNKNK